MHKKVIFVTDPIYLDHDTGPWHPESADRLRAIERALAPIERMLLRRSPIRVSESLLETVHRVAHIESVRRHCDALEPIDADTICSDKSWDAALAAAGAGIVALDAIDRGEASRAFCAVRPPGHHATSERSMGFCLFNNIAIAARYAQSIGYRKVAIVDFDVHHGNGTQEIFYDDGSVLYVSTHQSPAYPGTGGRNERGIGDGFGTTFNFPFPPGSGDEELVGIYENELPGILADFRPDILLVSAGYDLHRADPLAQLNVTTEGVRRIVRAILESRDAPMLFMLEGGYDLHALGECVRMTIEELLHFRNEG